VARPRLKYFRFREVGNAVELVCIFREVTPEVESEAASVFAMLYYQTRNHIKLDLYTVDYIPMNFLNRILNLAMDLREKKRVLILLGISPSLYHFINRFSLHENIFLQKDGLIRIRKDTNSHLTKEEIPGSPPSLPKAEVS
jgi:anti-anti-sigma regulatory factor